MRRVRSGIYSWVNSKKLPRGRTFQVVRRELSHLREELVQAHGGETISPDAQILVDSVVEGLGVQKILGLYIRKYGVIDGQSIKQGRLELSPLLSRNWIGYSNVVRMGILALKEIDKGRQASSQADIEAILTSYSRVDELEAAQGGQGDGQAKDEGEHDRVGKEAEIEAPASTSNEIQKPEQVK